MLNDEIRQRLFEMSDEKYKSFLSKLIPGELNIIGVRAPEYKKLAKKLLPSVTLDYLGNPYLFYHEECIFLGYIIANLELDLKQRLYYIDKHIHCLKNWASCDFWVSNFKFFAENKEIVKPYLEDKLISSDNSFVRRFCICSLFVYFIDGIYDTDVAKIFSEIKVNTYYEKMAVAWGVAELMFKNNTLALEILENKKLDVWTHNKAIQKSCESFKIAPDKKQYLKTLLIKTTKKQSP